MSDVDLAAAAALVADADAIVMACHVSPDGDALGSMLGMALAATRAGKTVAASFGEPFTLPASFRFLPVDLLVPPRQVPEEPGLMVTFDAGSADRLGNLAPVAARAGSVLVVDHHVSNEGFGSHNLLVPDAAATAEIVADLLDELGWPIDAEIATCLHTGLVTDTGRFQYANTTPKTLHTAARLVAAGARPEQVGRHMYEESPFGSLAAAGAVLGRARLEADRRFVWSALLVDDLKAAGITVDETDGLIDLIRVAEESDVALLVKDMGDGRIKGSLRSRGRVDVGAIAVALGGGGHHNAAGFTYRGTVDGAVEEVRSRLDVVDG